MRFKTKESEVWCMTVRVKVLAFPTQNFTRIKFTNYIEKCNFPQSLQNLFSCCCCLFLICLIILLWVWLKAFIFLIQILCVCAVTLSSRNFVVYQDLVTSQTVWKIFIWRNSIHTMDAYMWRYFIGEVINVFEIETFKFDVNYLRFIVLLFYL